MRVYFDLKESDPMAFEHKGVKYLTNQLTLLAEKRRLATNIYEYVYRLPTNECVYITVVGDEDQTSADGIGRGWYVIETLSEKDAQFAIDALAKFTALYR